MLFIKQMLEQSLTWAEGGHVPAYIPTFDSAAYKKLTPQSNYAAAAETAVFDDAAWYGGSGSTFERHGRRSARPRAAGQLVPRAGAQRDQVAARDVPQHPEPPVTRHATARPDHPGQTTPAIAVNTARKAR